MAVFPTRSAGARSAPFSSNSFTSSALPEKLAAISGVTFDRLARFTSAPLSRASRATPLWPFFSAIMSGVSPRRLREFTAAPPSSRRVTAVVSPCRAATRSWALGGRSCAPAETGASRQRDKANLRINVFLRILCRWRVSRLPTLLDRTFVPIVTIYPGSRHAAVSANLNNTQQSQRRIHAHPSPFLHCRKPVFARIQQRSGPGGQGRNHHRRSADVAVARASDPGDARRGRRRRPESSASEQQLRADPLLSRDADRRGQRGQAQGRVHVSDRGARVNGNGAAGGERRHVPYHLVQPRLRRRRGDRTRILALQAQDGADHDVLLRSEQPRRGRVRGHALHGHARREARGAR